MMRRALLPLICALLAGGAAAAAPPAAVGTQRSPPPQPGKWPTREGDFVAHDFRFADGETLAELKLHYTTLGAPRRDAQGRITNAVMVLHGTGGSGAQFLRPQFADVLYRPGGVLDIAKWYVILPDGIGHGASSKPSDGLKMKFPHYGYADMVRAQHMLLTEGLHVDRLRLLMGTSMGCMHDFMWAETWPAFAQAVFPAACETVEIAGRNRMWRRMTIEAIERDPAWRGGDYASEPVAGLKAAEDFLVIAGSAPLPMQIAYPTAAKADAYLAKAEAGAATGVDANDLIYAVDASRDYDPHAGLERITAPLTWVNSGDDFINPPELGLPQQDVKRIAHGRFVLIAAGPDTHGHGTHTWAALWQDDLQALLARSGPTP